MSIHLQMLQVARLAPKLAGDATTLMTGFLQRRQLPDGSFPDRAGQSDLYYTVFGLDALQSLQQPIDALRLREYLEAFGPGTNLDFVHLCCLARCWSVLPVEIPGEWRPSILHRLEAFRTPNGGYHPRPQGPRNGTAYGAFLALGAYQDLRAELPEPQRLLSSLDALQTLDGVWINEWEGKDPPPAGSTNATAAAILVQQQYQLPPPPEAGAWLGKRFHPQGGFCAAPGVAIPDLLSTATTLHALAAMEADLFPVREPCLDFLDSLWTNEGAFFGHWQDDALDCEYLFYALLALGHLSLV